MTRPADHAARHAARVTFDAPVVVEAGAGTGKTAVLVQRVVTWILGPGWARHAPDTERDDVGAPSRRPTSIEDTAVHVLQRVLALTFTEKAAGEMAVRVAEALDLLAHGDDYFDLTADAFPDVDGEALKARARACLIHLDRLPVTTIHAWCRRILVNHPVEASLHPAFEVDADGMRRRAVLDEVVAEWVASAFGDDPDEDAMALAAAEKGPAAIWEALGTLAEEGVDPNDIDVDPFSRERFTKARDRLLGAADRVASAFAPLCTNTQAKASAAAATWLVEFRAALVDANGFSDLQPILDSDAVGTVSGRLRDWANGKFNGAEEAAIEGVDRPTLTAALRRLRAEIMVWAKFETDLLPRAARTLRSLLTETRNRLHERGILSFSDLLHRAQTLLQNPAVCQEVRESYDQLLVDEFQDTDRRQYDIVGSLALEGDPDARPGLFLVGDPKQSIYGWRQADLGAYERFLNRLKDAHDTEPLALTVNFRSVPAILHEVERVMERSMEPTPGLQPAFEALRPCDDLRDDPGFDADGKKPVELWVSWNLDDSTGEKVGMKTTADSAREIEAAAIAEDIRSIRDGHGLAWNKFGILVRAKTSLEKYLHALRHAGVPFLVEGDREFYKRREVIDAVNFVRVILDPNDHIALVGFIRSSMVGVPDAALIPLWETSFPQFMSELEDWKTDSLERLHKAVETARSAVPGDVPPEALVDGWEHTLREGVIAVARLRRSFAEDAADVFVDRLRSALLTECLEAARYLGAHRAANLDQIFRKILDALTTGESGPDAVLRVLKERIEDIHPEKDATIAQDDVDAVRVMTIHMAKGLAFDQVYLPDLHREDQDREADGSRVAHTLDGSPEARLLGMPTPGWGEVRQHERDVREAELVRLLYVAVTRARRRLVMIGTWNDPEKMRPVSMLGHIKTRPGAWKQRLLDWDADPDDAPPFLDDEFGARWRLLRPTSLAGRESDDEAAPWPDPAEIKARSAHWLESAEAASRRASRPRTIAASSTSHESLVDGARDRRDWIDSSFEAIGDDSLADSSVTDAATIRPAVATDTTFAREIGTAIHRIIERLDLEGDPVWSFAQAADRLETELADLVPSSKRDRAVAAARPLVESLAGSDLIQRLFALKDHIIGREVALLLDAPSVDGCEATGAVVGAIDLLYRDPDTGEFVVADYKTDRVSDEADLDRHAASYASQGASYVTAVQRAFSLDRPPRFELWFLQHDVVR